MHIEFIDVLRCPVPHEDSWLVAAVLQMDGRIVIEAKLGCPVCAATYFVRDGVGLFDVDAVRSDDGDAYQPTSGSEGDERATTVAAFLDLTRPDALALLAGDWSDVSVPVARLTGARVIAFNSARGTHDSPSVADIRSSGRIPLAERSLDGVALDRAHTTSPMLSDAARLLRPRGRLLAAASASLTPEFRELARDADHVVAEYVGELVALRR